MLRIVVIGSAAGGGFPQWNCSTDACNQARTGDALARTQSSLAVTADDEHWYLFNASPDLRHQINSTPALHPKNGLRHSPISGVIVTNADVDHIAGLLTLRESAPLVLYATERVHGTLRANSVFNVLNSELVARLPMTLGQSFELKTPEGKSGGMIIEPFVVPGKVALYLENPDAGPNFGSQSEDTIGLRIQSMEGGEYFFYIPGCASVPPELAARLQSAPLVLFDGTLWQDDEMQVAGVGIKTGQRMGHISMSGPEGAIAALEGLNVVRKVFVHINNTNPTLLADSPERHKVEALGWEIAFDGMEICL
ncbi:MAG TPA: pyrroloquinoline quinone biosynthesis protein PqqB [Sneathiellales bacterium]|nr:pyrroloquinoline quinone biosynthesis protein PqqB [Sneathiellales bacterium]